MAKQQEDQAFVEFVVKGLVNNPDDVTTTRTVDEMGVLISVKVNPDDMGIIIGRSGQTARAIRTLVRVVGAKNNARVNLRIEEPEGGRKEAAAPSKSKEEAKAPKEGAKDIDEAVKDLDL